MYSSCRIIVDKIDKNRDHQVSQEELEDWVRHVAKRYVYDDVDSVWDYHDLNSDGYIDLEEYKNVSFGVIDGKSSIVTISKGYRWHSIR